MDIVCEMSATKEFALSSKEIANVIGIKHKDLAVTIAYYCHFINRLSEAGGNDKKYSSLDVQDFFIPQKKTTKKGKERLFYVVTYKGCKLIASGLPKDVRSKFEKSFEDAFMILQTCMNIPHIPKNDSGLLDLFQYLNNLNKPEV